MLKIYKYFLNIVPYQQLTVPVGQVLKFQKQRKKGEEVICFWLMFNDKTKSQQRTFYLYPTGADIDKDQKQRRKGTGDTSLVEFNYLATIQMSNGLVWHVFETVKF